jgi:hypothetical protein
MSNPLAQVSSNKSERQRDDEVCCRVATEH